MQVIRKRLVLFLWMHTLTLVKSQECTLQQFLKGSLYDSNFDTAALEDSYPNGRQLRVGCNVGFSGFFKLTCVDGKWHPRGTKCQPRPCGHPGDAQFADFHLERGNDFVFGSQVAYVCHKGYQMVSRSNHRHCMAEGWNGVVPVCEAQRCPVIHVDDNVKVTGDPEEATYGNVVRFSCKSSAEVLNGSPEIYCDENGEWSGVGWEGKAPKCEEIKCTVPVIKNGFVPGGIQEYKEHEVLNFQCDPLYKRAEERVSKCTKVGQTADWSPTPLCEPVKCKLTLPPVEGTTYEPAFRSVFSPGDTVRVTCGQTHWIVNTKSNSAETTCKDDGSWTIRPVCREVICSNQRDPLVDYWGVFWGQQKKLGDTVRYRCKSGYESAYGKTEAMCTRDGWTPNPLCEAITCRRKNYLNADIVGTIKSEYRYGEHVEYICKNGHEGHFTITCGGDGWIGSPQCTRTRCEKLDIENAYITYNNKARYNDGEQVQYTCRNSGGKRLTLTCERGVWNGMKSCSDNSPCPKAAVPHGFVAGPYEDKLYYTCDVGYKLFTKGWWGVAKCNGGVWSGLQQCIEKTKCGEPPVIPNGKATPQHTDGSAQRLQIVCNKGHVAQTDQLVCHEGKWRANGASLKTICISAADHCSPPPRVENAVVLTAYQKEYLSDSEVTYQCRHTYIMEGENTIRCKAGKWEEKNTTCILKPCPIPEDIPNGSYHIIVGEEFVFGTTIIYICNAGYRSASLANTRSCTLNGWTNTAPICKPAICEVDVLHPGLNATGLPSAGQTIKTGHKLQFHCSDEYDLDGFKEIECLPNGQWNAPFPTCSEKCEFTGVPANVHTTHAPGNHVMKGQKLTFTCRLRGHFIQGNATVECLEKGQWSDPFPTCGPPVHCGNPPPLSDGDTKESLTYRYEHNEKVEYICQKYYIMAGGTHKTCINGKWTGQLRCLKPCTVARDAMTSHNIRFKYISDDKLYSSHDDEIEFVCTSGRSVVGTVAMRQKCLDGVMQLPTCQ